VLDLFTKLDKKRTGKIEINELLQMYEGMKKFSGTAYFQNFLEDFREYHNILSGNKRMDKAEKLVDAKEFVAYHAYISSKIEKDKFFEGMLNSSVIEKL